MPITWTDVVAIAPELATVAGATQTAILADVALMVNAVELGARYDMASKYLAAHLATIGARGGSGPGGALAGETVGPISRQYAVPTFLSDSMLMSTGYGIEFKRILSLGLGRMGIV